MRFSLLLYLFIFATCAFGEEYNLEKIVKIANQNNIDLINARSSIEAQEKTSFASYYNFLPQISSSYSINQNKIEEQKTNSNKLDLTINQNLFSGLSDLNKIRIAKIDLEISKLNFNKTSAEQSYNIIEALENFLYNQKAILLFKEIIKRREQNNKMIELKFNSGSENKGALVLYEAYLEDAKLNLLETEHTLVKTRRTLEQLLGIEINENFKFIGDVVLENNQNKISNTNDFHEIALETPEVRIATKNQEKANIAANQDYSAFLPTISAYFTSYKQNQNLSNRESKTNGQSIGLSISLPLFNGGRDFFNKQKDKISLFQSELNKEKQYKQIELSIADAYDKKREAEQRYKVDFTYYNAAIIRSKIAREKYNNGLLSFDNWDTIENDLIAKETNKLISEKNKILAEAQYQKIIGKGLFTYEKK